jgi:hypothetical protein
MPMEMGGECITNRGEDCIRDVGGRTRMKETARKTKT